MDRAISARPVFLRKRLDGAPIAANERALLPMTPPFELFLAIDRFPYVVEARRVNKSDRPSRKRIAQRVNPMIVLCEAPFQVARHSDVVGSVGAEYHVNKVSFHVVLLRREQQTARGRAPGGTSTSRLRRFAQHDRAALREAGDAPPPLSP